LLARPAPFGRRLPCRTSAPPQDTGRPTPPPVPLCPTDTSSPFHRPPGYFARPTQLTVRPSPPGSLEVSTAPVHLPSLLPRSLWSRISLPTPGPIPPRICPPTRAIFLENLATSLPPRQRSTSRVPALPALLPSTSIDIPIRSLCSQPSRDTPFRPDAHLHNHPTVLATLALPGPPPGCQQPSLPAHPAVPTPR